MGKAKAVTKKPAPATAKKAAPVKASTPSSGAAEFEARVLRVISNGEQKSVSEVAEALGVDNSFVRRAVKRLAGAKSVTLGRKGTSITVARV